MIGALGALLIAMLVGERPTSDYLLTISLVAFAVATAPPRGVRRFWAIAMLPALVLLVVSFYLDEVWSAIVAAVAIGWYVANFAYQRFKRRR